MKKGLPLAKKESFEQMAIVRITLDPNYLHCVDLDTFDNHKHDYEKIESCAFPGKCNPINYTPTQTTTPSGGS
jgi:hypothetical protein